MYFGCKLVQAVLACTGMSHVGNFRLHWYETNVVHFRGNSGGKMLFCSVAICRNSVLIEEIGGRMRDDEGCIL